MTSSAKTRYAAATVQDFEKKNRMIVEIKGMELGLFRANGAYYAYRNICPHAAAPVCEGTICGTRLPSGVFEYVYGKDQEVLRCPWHGWEFDLTSGKHLADESGVKLRGYEVQVEGDQIYIVI
jgi:nitrite reductase (NADH) small subunit